MAIIQLTQFRGFQGASVGSRLFDSKGGVVSGYLFQVASLLLCTSKAACSSKEPAAPP